MAHFVYFSGHTDPIPDGHVPSSVEYTLLWNQLYASINGDDGGTWAPGAFITVGGSGFNLTGTGHTVAASARLNVASTGEIKVLSGGTLRVDASGALDVYGTATVKSGGALTVASGGTVTTQNGSTVNQSSGSTWNLSGSTSVKGTVTVENSGGGGPGGIVWESDATMDVGSLYARVVSGGVLTWQSGSFLIGSAGASATWSAPWTFGGVTTFNASSSISGNASATSTWAGTWAFSNTVTQSGILAFSGDNGYQSLRTNTGPDSSASVDLYKQDVLIVPDITGDRQWTLTHPPANRLVRCTIEWPASTANHSLELLDGAVSLIIVDSSSGASRLASIVMLYDGSKWVVESAYHRPRVYLAGSDASITVDAWRYDVIVVPSISTNRTWTFTRPPVASDVIKEVSIRWASSANILTIQNDGGGNFLAITGSVSVSGSNATVGYDGSNWYTKGIYS